MKIRMLTTVPGAVDGVRAEYVEGGEYDLGWCEDAEALARVMVNEGYAVEVAADREPEHEQEPNLEPQRRKRK
jgi:endonuclease YncB( thermonuclease family)